jgi:hypothetical protein
MMVMESDVTFSKHGATRRAIMKFLCCRIDHRHGGDGGGGVAGLRWNAFEGSSNMCYKMSVFPKDVYYFDQLPVKLQGLILR